MVSFEPHLLCIIIVVLGVVGLNEEDAMLCLASNISDKNHGPWSIVYTCSCSDTRDLIKCNPQTQTYFLYCYLTDFFLCSHNVAYV